MPETLLTYHDLSVRLQLDRTTIWKMVNRRELPQPIKLGRAVRWRETEIDAHLAALTAPQPDREPGPDGDAGASGDARPANA